MDKISVTIRNQFSKSEATIMVPDMPYPGAIQAALLDCAIDPNKFDIQLTEKSDAMGFTHYSGFLRRNGHEMFTFRCRLEESKS